MSAREEILVGVDGSAGGRAAIAWAVAEAHSRRCGLLLVHVSRAAPNLWATPPSVRRGLRYLAQPIVDDGLAYAASLAPDVAARGRVLLGDPHRALVSISATAVMTVVGRRGNNAIVAKLVGSLSQTLMAHSHNPVIAVAPDTDHGRPAVGRVVVAVGDRLTSLRTLCFGIEEARRHMVELCVLHAWQVPDLPPGHCPFDDTEAAVRAGLETAEREWLSATLTGSGLETAGLRVRPMVVAGSPVRVLREFCTPSDLLVLGQHRHSRYSPAVLGPVLSGTLHQVRCTVATAGDAVLVSAARAVSAPQWMRREQPMASGVLSY